MSKNESQKSFLIIVLLNRTIHHQINENEINLTIRPGQGEFLGEPSHATITIEVNFLSHMLISSVHANFITC